MRACAPPPRILELSTKENCGHSGIYLRLSERLGDD
jgi:hypothetical protein